MELEHVLSEGRSWFQSPAGSSSPLSQARRRGIFRSATFTQKQAHFSGNSEGAVELAMIRSKLGEELVVGDACEDCKLGWRFHTPTAQLTSW